jgi:hypothetical protein
LNAEALDRLRVIGDPPVDRLVDAHAAAHGDREISRLLGVLFGIDRLPESEALVRRYVGEVPAPMLEQPLVVEQGQRIFELFGPEILLLLGAYSLPAAFAAGDGVQVTYRARKLKDEPVRRLCDTAQMVLNVMRAGELGAGRAGERSARKVRLIHALVRHHLQHVAGEPWPPAWGVPINQEDQGGTLITFSAAILDGLRRLGAEMTTAEADAYIVAWSAVGRLLGIDPLLLPTTEADALTLARLIGKRQIRATPEGRELMGQLGTAMETLYSFKGYGNSLMHFFLKDTVFGVDVTEILELPPVNWTSWLVKVRAAEKRKVLRWLGRVPGAKARRRFLAKRFAQAMIALRRPDGRIPFEVPPGLIARWGLGAPPGSL